MFMWTVNHGRITTNEERNSRGLTSNPYCKACSGEVEGLNHTFRYCMKSIPKWKGISRDKDMADTYHLSFEDWYAWHLKAKKMIDGLLPWRDQFAVCMWWIWRWRNNHVLENVDPVPSIEIESIKNYTSTMGSTTWFKVAVSVVDSDSTET